MLQSAVTNNFLLVALLLANPLRRFLRGWAGLDDDQAFQTALKKKAIKFIADGGGKDMDHMPLPVPAGTDMSVYNDTFFALSELSEYESFFYDSAIQAGLGACKALKDNGANFTFDAATTSEKEIFATMLTTAMINTTFAGWSGVNMFDQVTGSRKASSTSFSITQAIHDPSDDSLTVTKVGDWNNARDVPFNFDCYGCVDMMYGSGEVRRSEERSDGWSEATAYCMAEIFSSSPHSSPSHIAPSCITNNLPLFASLILENSPPPEGECH